MRKIAIPSAVTRLPVGSIPKRVRGSRSLLCHPYDNLLAFRNEILDRRVPVRKSGKQDQYPLLVAFTPWRSPRKRMVMHRLWRKQLERGHVTSVEGGKELTDQGFVLFG